MAGITVFYQRVLADEPSGFVTTDSWMLECSPFASSEVTVTLTQWSCNGWDIILVTYFPPNSQQRTTQGTFLMLEPEPADVLHYIQVCINNGGSKGCKEEQGRVFSMPGNEKATFHKEPHIFEHC